MSTYKITANRERMHAAICYNLGPEAKGVGGHVFAKRAALR